MKPTKLIVAAVVLVALSGLVYWAKKNPQDKSTSEASPKFADVSEAQVQSLDLQKKGGPALVLARQSGKWAITAPTPYAADQDTAASVASALSSVNADSVVEEKPTDAARYGLADPSLTVTAHEKNGKIERFFFGDDVPASSTVYARVDKDPKVYAISSSVKTSLAKDVNDLRDKRLLTFDSSQVTRLEVVAGKSDMEFGKSGGTDWQLIKPQVYRADSFQVDDLLRKLGDAKMDLSVKDEETQKAVKGFNSGTPVASAKVTDASGVQTLDIRKSKDDFYGRSSVVTGTFKINSDLSTALTKPVDDFRNKKLFDFGFGDLNRLEIQQGTSDKNYARTGTDWKLNKQTMDAGTVQAAIDKLRDLAATGFPESGFTTPALTVTAVSNDNKRTERVEFSKTPDGYIAQRQGQPSLYKLDAKAVNDILEAGAAIKPAAAAKK
jgi:hypothetical protein